MDHTHTSPKPIARLWVLFRPEKRELWMIIFFALFVSLLSLVIPIGIEALVTTVIFGVAVWPLIWLAGIMLFCLGLAGFIIAIENYLVELLQRRLFVRVIADLAWRLPRLSLGTIQDANGPSLLNRYFEIMTIQKSLGTLLLEGTRLTITNFVGLVVLAFYHPLLLAFSLGLILLQLILLLLGWGGVRTSIDESVEKYRMADWLEDIARHPRMFKTGHGPAFAFHHSEAITREYLAKRSAHFQIVMRQIAFGLFLYVASSVLLLGLGGYLVIVQQLTIGQLVAAELIVALIVGSFAKIGKYINAWFDICTSVEKLGHITDLAVERQGGTPLSAESDDMRVSFHWKGLPSRCIVNAGERLVLRTPTGYRLDELLESVAGLRDVPRGTVELDGIDLADLDLNSVRTQVAYVQAVELFTGTLADNLSFGTEHEDQAMREVLRLVGLSDRVNALPEGLHQPLQPTGYPLSLEEALRFSIARALLARPRLLILNGVLDLINLSACPQLINVLKDPSRPGTILIATDAPDVAAQFGRTIVVTPADRNES